MSFTILILRTVVQIFMRKNLSVNEDGTVYTVRKIFWQDIRICTIMAIRTFPERFC